MVTLSLRELRRELVERLQKATGSRAEMEERLVAALRQADRVGEGLESCPPGGGFRGWQGEGWGRGTPAAFGPDPVSVLNPEP